MELILSFVPGTIFCQENPFCICVLPATFRLELMTDTRAEKTWQLIGHSGSPPSRLIVYNSRVQRSRRLILISTGSLYSRRQIQFKQGRNRKMKSDPESRQRLGHSFTLFYHWSSLRAKGPLWRKSQIYNPADGRGSVGNLIIREKLLVVVVVVVDADGWSIKTEEWWRWVIMAVVSSSWHENKFVLKGIRAPDFGFSS